MAMFGSASNSANTRSRHERKVHEGGTPHRLTETKLSRRDEHEPLLTGERHARARFRLRGQPGDGDVEVAGGRALAQRRGVAAGDEVEAHPRMPSSKRGQHRRQQHRAQGRCDADAHAAGAAGGGVGDVLFGARHRRQRGLGRFDQRAPDGGRRRAVPPAQEE